MARTRRNAVIVGPLICLLMAVLGGAAPAVQGHLTRAGASRHIDEQWVPSPQRIVISGNVQAMLGPGVSTPVKLAFSNLNSYAVRLRRVRVTIIALSAPHADALHPCTRADFAVQQMPRGTLRVRRGLSDLASLRVPLSRWPYLAMLNRPVNQDGCKGAQLTLRYLAHRVRR
jgi:hypothetical protein